MARILVTRPIPSDAEERLADAGHDVRVWRSELPPTPGELRSQIGETEGLLCMLTERIDQSVLDAAPRLRVVSNFAVGSDNIDLDACAARGIPVGTTPGVLTDATADMTMALILAAARNLLNAATDVRDGRWRTWEPRGWLGLELRGARLVLVGGNGRIGSAVAERARAFGMGVEAVGRHDDLHDALRRADVVSLHVPLTAETHHLIDAGALGVMRRTAILVNTARGGIVDQAALVAALRDRRIAGAALDVTDPEPPPSGDPLLAAPNLLVTPHIASATRTARTRMAEMAVANVLAGLHGEPLPHPADQGDR